MPREGGAIRVEHEAWPRGCFGSCGAVDDDTLYVSAGNSAEPGGLVAVDQATATPTTRDAPWALSLGMNGETVFGMSCYDLWSMPREGGDVTALLHTDVWGEDVGPDCATALVADETHLYMASGEGLVRTAHDWTNRELLLADDSGSVRFALRGDDVYVYAGGEIRHLSDDRDELVTTAEDVAGIAVAGDVLYWTEDTTSGALAFFELEL